MKPTIPVTPLWLPGNEDGDGLVDITHTLRPLTDLVIPLETRRALDRVMAENQQAQALAARGLRPANRLLFCGPSGCGKTVAAGAVALALGIPLASVRLDAIISSFMGKTAAHLRKVFDLAKNQRVVLFLDEVDALGRARDQNGKTNDVGEANRFVNSLLVMLEELHGGPSLVVAATNHEGMLDSAIWRRFDEVVMFPKPTGLQAAALLKQLVERHDTRLGTRLSPPSLAPWTKRLAGMSFADVERVALDAVKATVLEESLGIEDALSMALDRQKARRALTTTKGK